MVGEDESSCVRYSLRQATSANRQFVKDVYFESQREQVVDLCGAAAADKWFDSFYSERETQIILVDDQEAGFLSLLRDPGRANIQCLFLRSEYQGRGIGTHLLRAIIDETASADERLTIGTEKINRARQLYERLGFVVIRETKFRVEFAYPHVDLPD